MVAAMVMSPEVAADAAELPKAAVLASTPCVVVSSNALSAQYVTVEGTIDEHCFYPVKETVNELQLFSVGTTVEPPEVSVVSSHLLVACPVTAMKAVSESSSCPVTSMEAACEPLPCFEPAMEANYKLAKDIAHELPDCPASATGAIQELSSRPVIAMVTLNELSACPVNPVIAKKTLMNHLSVQFQSKSLIPSYLCVQFRLVSLGMSRLVMPFLPMNLILRCVSGFNL